RNKRLQARVQQAEEILKDGHEHTGNKQRLVSEFTYAADSWNRPRRVLTRLEYGAQGVNPRFVVTNIAGSDVMQLYDRLYCARGEAENRSKEALLDLFGTRASCHRFAANQFRLLLAALALYADAAAARDSPAGHRTGARQRRHHPCASAE